MIYESKVKGFTGLCVCTWRNTSLLDNILDKGITGFFRQLKYPFKQFHGMFYKNKKTNKIIIFSTQNNNNLNF